MGKIKAGLKFERGVRKFIVNNIFNKIRVYNKQKIFCFGRNKTGTTSLKKTFSDLGFIVGDQKMAERLTPHYFEGNFQRTIRYCRTTQVFQDVPFGYPETFKHSDMAFPGSKFILAIRNSSAFSSSTDNFKRGSFQCPLYMMLKNHVWLLSQKYHACLV